MTTDYETMHRFTAAVDDALMAEQVDPNVAKRVMNRLLHGNPDAPDAPEAEKNDTIEITVRVENLPGEPGVLTVAAVVPREQVFSTTVDGAAIRYAFEHLAHRVNDAVLSPARRDYIGVRRFDHERW